MVPGILLASLLVATQSALAAKPKCGDGIINGKDLCDGTDLGGATCTTLGYTGGTLSCSTKCTFDTSECTLGGTVCGDDIVNDYEECDGTDDSACPGECSAHCACPSMAPGDLEFHVIDVGQGDGLLVVSPDGFTMLIDGGEEVEAAAVEAYLSTLGVVELDYTLASHMHADHIDALDVILANHPEVVACFDHGGSYTTTAYSDYAATAGSRRTTVSTGSTIDLGPSMTAQVLHASVGSVAGLTLALGNSGDYLTLTDDVGAEADFVAWESAVSGWTITASTGNAIERIDPAVDTDTVADWQVLSPAAPHRTSALPLRQLLVGDTEQPRRKRKPTHAPAYTARSSRWTVPTSLSSPTHTLVARTWPSVAFASSVTRNSVDALASRIAPTLRSPRAMRWLVPSSSCSQIRSRSQTGSASSIQTFPSSSWATSST